jgi:aquaporin Z
VATGNAYAIGATLTLVILLFGKLSGGHFNPGVTMMMLWKENVFMDTAIMFMIVQVVAGIAAVETWRYLVSAGLLPSKK